MGEAREAEIGIPIAPNGRLDVAIRTALDTIKVDQASGILGYGRISLLLSQVSKRDSSDWTAPQRPETIHTANQRHHAPGSSHKSSISLEEGVGGGVSIASSLERRRERSGDAFPFHTSRTIEIACQANPDAQAGQIGPWPSNLTR